MISHVRNPGEQGLFTSRAPVPPSPRYDPNLIDSKSGEIKISHEGKTSVPAYDYFRNHGVGDETVLPVISTNSRWQAVSSNADVWKVSLAELPDRMLHDTKPVYELAQASLAAVNWFGYNDHGPNHIAKVVNNFLRIASAAKLTEEEARIGIIAAACHDLGNLVCRDNHSVISPWIAVELFPSLLANPRGFEQVKRAIELHNSVEYKNALAPHDVLPEEARITAIRDVFGTAALGVLIADKSDIGRHRINDKALSPKAIDAHVYSEANLIVESKGLTIVPESTEANWTLDIRMDVNPEELPRFAQLTGPVVNGHPFPQVVLSNKSRQALDTEAQSPLAVAANLFWGTSFGDKAQLIKSAFALWSGEGQSSRIERFSVKLVDPHAKSKQNEELTFTFDRAQHLKQLPFVQASYKLKGRRE